MKPAEWKCQQVPLWISSGILPTFRRVLAAAPFVSKSQSVFSTFDL
jgi:hypothetical protein